MKRQSTPTCLLRIADISLELSLAEEKYSGDWFKQKYKDVLDEVMKSNPNITDYLLFTSYKALIDDTRKNITEEEGHIIDKVLSEKRVLIIEDPITHVRKKYLLVNISDPLYPAEMSLIVQLTYDDHLIHEKIQNLLIYHLLVAVIGIFSGVSLSLLISTPPDEAG